MSTYESGHDGRNRSQESGSQSQYLLERLQERRSRNTRPKRARHTDFGPRRGVDDDIFLTEAEESRNTRAFDSSPLTSEFGRKASEANPSSGGNRRRAPPGIRDMDAQLDQLNKQNFALKLELDHRREQTRKLQERIECMEDQFQRAEALETEHAELLEINRGLVEELEKRDKAVEEAVENICDLEEKIAELEERNNLNTRPSTAHADSGYAGTETHEQMPSSPPRHLPPKTPQINVREPSQPASFASAKLQGVVNGSTLAKAKREPAFMSEKKSSTHALRSVYLESSNQIRPVKSFQSLLSRQESRADDDRLTDDILNSPRLSVLSESSFQSLYSPKKQLSPDRFAWEAADESPAPSVHGGRHHLRTDSIKRVSQWISERDLPETTPSKSNQISTAIPDAAAQTSPISRQKLQEEHFQSLNDALSAAAIKSPDMVQNSTRFQPYPPRPDIRLPKQSRGQATSFGGPIFGEPLLPPTPDSASTRMLRASRSSIADDRSILDTTPAAVKGFDALKPAVASVPRQMRSSIELTGSNLRQMQTQHRGYGRGDSSSDDDDEEESHLTPMGNFDTDYDGYPDGKSIVMGTPSRFLRQPKASNDADLAHDGYGTAFENSRSHMRRRRSSVETSNGPPAKPRLARVETSPTIFGSIHRMISPNGKSSLESMNMTSPRSAHSNSSGNRTVVQNDDRPVSPEVSRSTSRPAPSSPPRSRPSASATGGIVQKAPGFFRRLSNSTGTDRNEKSPTLPTLTSTPSSAYVNTLPIEVRRPRTSHGADTTPKASAAAAAAPAPAPPSSREGRRPSLQSRTRTEPPPMSSEVPANEKKAGGLFKVKRSNSTQKTSPVVEAHVPAGDGRSGFTRRRGSIRDVVATAKRPWR